MNKYLELSFDSAKLYRDYRVDKSAKSLKPNPSKVSFQNTELKDRDAGREFGCFIEPITYFQVANVLLALTGKRPVNTIKFEGLTKDSIFNHNEDYINWAKDSFISYGDSINTYKNYKDETLQIREFKQSGEKIFHNSNVSQTRITWFDVEYFICVYLNNSECFTELEKVNNYYGINSRLSTFNSLIEKACDLKDFSVLFTWLESIRKVGNTSKDGTLFSYVVSYCVNYDENCSLLVKVNSKGENGDRVKANALNVELYNYKFTNLNAVNGSVIRTKEDRFIGHKIISGVSSCETYRGKLLIPIRNDEEENLFINNSGSATILDGGLITINGLKTQYDVKLKNYVKLSEISVERVKLK